MSNIFDVIIESLMLNHPLIWDWKVGCRTAYALAFENLAQRTKFIQNFANEIVLIDEAAGVPSLKKQLAYVNSRGICCILPEGKMSPKTQEKVEILRSVAELGNYEGTEVIAAVFFLCIERIPPIIANHVRVLRYGKLLEASPALLRKTLVIPRVQEFGLIQAAIGDLSASKGEVTTLAAASCFFNHRLSMVQQTGLKSWLDVLEEEMQAVNFADDINAEEIEEIFLDLIFEYAENGGFEEWFELPKLAPDAVERLQTAAFLKGDRLFVSERKLADIFQPISGSYTMREMLSALKMLGILECYGRGYAVRMNFYNVYGAYNRVFMLRFDITKIIAANGKPFKTYFY